MLGRAGWCAAVVGALLAASLVVGATKHVRSGGPEYISLPAPVRLLDTRPGETTVDGLHAGTGLRPAGSTLELRVAGRGGLPVDVASVVLNVAAVRATGDGYLTVHPAGTARPNASNLNYRAGDTIANSVVTRVGTAGRVSLFSFAAAHLVVDVAGYLPSGSYHPLPAPARLADTRPGHSTIDGEFAGIGKRSGDSMLLLDVAGRAGIPDSAASVVLNVTAVAPEVPGYLTVHPAGTDRPNASNVNHGAGQTIANVVVARVGVDGRIAIYTFGATHIVVDVAGHMPAETFTPLPSPQRLVDTRPGETTIDGQQAGIGIRPAHDVLCVEVGGRGNVPSDASAVILNVAAVRPLDGGFATAHPRGNEFPHASNLNYTAGAAIANTVIGRLGVGGDVCIYTSAATHLIVDVAGHLAGPPPPTTGPGCPESWYGTAVDLDGRWVGDINNDGVAVGDADNRAVWWPRGSVEPIVVDWRLPMPSRALRLNDRGQIVAVAGLPETVFVVDTWSSSLRALTPPFGERPRPQDINDRGQVVVNVAVPRGAEDQHYAALVWDTASGGLIRPPHPLANRPFFASGINDRGHVVGSSNGTGVLWDLNSGAVHELPLGAADAGSANSINDDGMIAGTLSWEQPGGGAHTRAAVWEHQAAQPHDLGTLSTTDSPHTFATDINDAGQMVGMSFPHLWVWDPTSEQMTDLRAGNAWSAPSINNAGQITGTSSGPKLWNPQCCRIPS